MADAFLTKETIKWDDLIADYVLMPITLAITLLTGQNRKRGDLLGKILKVLGSTTFTGTGNGVMSGQALKKSTPVGNIVVEMLTATTFKVVLPDGDRLDDGATGVAYSNDYIGFTITVGGVPFIAGDKFTIPITAGSGKYVLSLAAAVDGSQNPESILAEDKDATAEDKATVAYIKGTFNQNRIAFGTGHTAASTKDGLQAKDIILQTSVKAYA